MAKRKTSTLNAFWLLFKGFWTSEAKWSARGMLALIIALGAVKACCIPMMPLRCQKFESMFEAKAFERFIPCVQVTALPLVGFALAEGTRICVQQLPRLEWRVWMTDRFLTRWMSGRTCYRLQAMGGGASNPDQRISGDAGFFAKAAREMHRLIARELPAAGVGSVGHRSTLYALHDRLMQLAGGRDWSLKALPCRTRASPAWMDLSAPFTPPPQPASFPLPGNAVPPLWRWP